MSCIDGYMFGMRSSDWASEAPGGAGLSQGLFITQGSERSMLLEEVNGYKRALQHQALAKAQFGAPQPPGFSVQARSSCEPLPALHSVD